MNNKIILIKVAKVIDEFTVVINKGENDGLTDKDRFLIYTEGDEIIDPDSKKSLGRLEIVKGTAEVVHLQNNLTTIKSDSYFYKSPTKLIRTKNPSILNLNIFQTTETEEEIQEQRILKSFKKVNVGDLVKIINKN